MEPYLELLNYQHTAVLLVTSERDLVFANDSARNMLHGAQIPETDPVARLLQHPEVVDLCDQAQNQQRTYTQPDCAYQREDGEHIEFSCTVTPIQWRGVDTLLLELSISEHAHRHTQENMQRNASQMFSQLARNLAHELKTPLAGIQGAAQMLQKSSADDEMIQVINNEVKRLQGLVERVLGPSATAQKIESINVHQIIEYALELVSVRPDWQAIDIQRDYDPSLPDIEGHRDMLGQVLINICNNAADALIEGETAQPMLKVRTRMRHQVAHPYVPSQRMLGIEIINNGLPIPQEIRASVFFPLISGRAKGSGLGLAISRNIVEQHQGLIEYTSDENATVFCILLPIKD